MSLTPIDRAKYRAIVGYVQPSVPRAGKIRLGIKVENDKGSVHPKDCPYFVFDSDLEGRDRITDVYGDKPTRLVVMFLSDDIGEIFPHAYKSYRKGLGLWCKGNGSTAMRAKLTKDGARDVFEREEVGGAPITVERACPCELLTLKKCKPIGNLMVILPEIGFAAYQIDTGSLHSFHNIVNSLRHYQGFFGSLKGVLFSLERREIVTHGSGREEKHWPLVLTTLGAKEYAERRARVHAMLSEYVTVLGRDIAGDATAAALLGTSTEPVVYEGAPHQDIGSLEVEHDIMRDDVVDDDDTPGVSTETLNEQLQHATAPESHVDHDRNALLVELSDDAMRADTKRVANKIGINLARWADFKNLPTSDLQRISDHIRKEQGESS
jgi:hypothetical protein